MPASSTQLFCQGSFVSLSNPFQRRFGRLLAAVCLGLSCVGASLAADDITLNFVDADIESAVKAVGQTVGRNFVLDPRVKGTINIVSGRPVSRDMAYQVLVSALRLQGYAVVEGSAVTKIMPDADARVQGGPVDSAARGDQIVTRVFHIQYEVATQLMAALKPLVGANQSITANASSNTLVITDTADNLRRIERIIASIDVPHGDDPRVLTLRHASAVDVASMLTKLFAGNAGNLAAIADARANRIILRADNPGLLVRVTTLVGELDKPDAGFGNIRVIYLKNAEAAKMAQLLRTIMASEGSAGNPAGNAAAGQRSANQPRLPQAPAMAGQRVVDKSDAVVMNGVEEGNALQAGSIIQADVSSNALIVTASDAVFANLQNVVGMLDRRRAQVHIEALIVEVSAERAAEFGIQWQDISGLAKNGTRGFGGTAFNNNSQNILNIAGNVGKLGGGLSFGLTDGKITLPGLGTITNLKLLARFLETEAQANILSTPSIMTLDNEEAKIVIGQNLPFVTGSYSTTNTTGTVTPFQTYERRDVGLTLKVRPMITEGGVVRIQIYQEASSVQTGTAGNTAGPITNTRSIESNVLVDDGSVMVIGGLIEDSFGNNEEKVPLLGDVPGLGNLFRYENRNRRKTNLMVFLRPSIVRDGLDYLPLAADRYDTLLKAQKKQTESAKPLWGDATQPQLPPFVPNSKPAEASKPAEEAKPVEEAKPAEEDKPVGIAE